MKRAGPLPLRRRAKNLSGARHPMHPVQPRDPGKVGLPWIGLPDGIGDLPPGSAALLLCADFETRECLIATLADRDAAAPGRSVTWLCAAAQSTVFIAGERHQAARDGRLRRRAWSEDAAARVRACGPAEPLRELHGGGMARQDLLVVDLFEPWLDEMAEGAALEAGIAQALECLAHWSQEQEGPIIALAPTQRRGLALLPLVARSNVARLASLRVQGGRAELEVVRWGDALASGDGAGGWRCTMAVPARGDWPSRRAAPVDLRAALVAADAQSVHVVAGVLHDAATTPDGWRVYPSLEALAAAAGRAVAATVVLDFDRPVSVHRVAGVVARLRRAHPALLRIVVRETGATLRRNGELALLRIGANAVLRREMGFAEVVQAIADLRGELYQRVPAPDPALTLLRLAPDPVHGYLAPTAFCAAVERMLERTAETLLEHALVHVPLPPHLGRADALPASLPRRDGDLVSADEHGLYFFFFGCPGHDALPALDAMFAANAAGLARHARVDDERPAQLALLAELRRRHRAAAAPDAMHRATDPAPAIAPPPRAARGMPLHGVVLPTVVEPPARSVHAHALPLRSAAF